MNPRNDIVLRRAGDSDHQLQRDGILPQTKYGPTPSLRGVPLTRVVVRLGLGLSAAGVILALWLTDKGVKKTDFEIKHRYLVVTVEGPPGWENQHCFRVVWQGKTIQLPVAFRVAGSEKDFPMRADTEFLRCLEIGKARLPVTAEPDMDFRVGIACPVATMPEKGSQEGAVSISFVTWVAVSPPDHPGELSPMAAPGETRSSANKLQKRVRNLLATGKVIDLPSPR